MRRDLTGWLLGGATVVAMAVAVEATRHAAHADGSPIDPRGGWHGAWIAATILAYLFAAAAVVLARRRRLRLRVAVVVAVVVQLLPLAGPLLLSRDAYLYWAEARVFGVHHANPYRVTPSQYPGDPSTQVASPQWRTETEPYGPAWVAVGTVPEALAGSSPDRAQLLYRVLACLGVLATIGVLAYRRRTVGVALLGWSPLIALHYAGGGHSDALLALFLVVALAFSSGWAWPVAAMFKAVPVVVLPLELARARLQLPRRWWIGLVATAVVLAAAAVALFGTAWASTSVVAAHGTSPIGGVHFLTQAGLRHRYAVAIGGLVFVAVYLVLLRRAWRGREAHLGFALAALCMCSSLLRPWYALWPLAVAATEEDGLSVAAAFALSGYVLFADATPSLL